jgi:hypothetical protein
MIRVNFHWISTLNVQKVFVVLLILINHCSSKSDYRHGSTINDDLPYDDLDENESSILINPKMILIPDSNEILTRNPWSQFYHNYHDRTRYLPIRKLGSTSNHHENRYISNAKRSIPLELRKALFAHGIVGRRR